VFTGTARQGISGKPDATAGAGPGFGETGTTAGGLVVLRDELGILSVMRCLDADLTLDPGFQYGYPAESAAMAGLGDPRLAPPLSYVVDAAGQIVAIVCRHVTGVRLSKVLEQLPRGLDVQAAAVVLKDVLAALAALHERGVPHRALDPRNVIVEPNGNCVLVDVGLIARPGEADLAADLAADLDLAAGFFVSCLATGRRLPDPKARQGYFAAGELEGVAAQMYVALEAVTADSFDAGWDGRSRERLAAAAREHRSSRRRFLEFHATGHTDRNWSIRGWHAGRPRVARSRQRLVASGEVMRQARAQIVSLWAGNGRGTGSHAAEARGGAHLVRYLIPLIAFLLAFGLALLLLGG
jgi:hypothetical protein